MQSSQPCCPAPSPAPHVAHSNAVGKEHAVHGAMLRLCHRDALLLGAHCMRLTGLGEVWEASPAAPAALPACCTPWQAAQGSRRSPAVCHSPPGPAPFSSTLWHRDFTPLPICAGKDLLLPRVTGSSAYTQQLPLMLRCQEMGLPDAGH